jgi:small multidrug resistance pump
MWAWFCLYMSIALEVGATTSLRLSNNFERLHFAGLAVLLYIFCFFFLAQVLKLLPAGIAYAIWAGVGTVAIAIISVVWFGETMTMLRGLFITLIIAGVVGLNITGHQETRKDIPDPSPINLEDK